MCLRSSALRNKTTDVPLMAKPYLCVSADMDDTPGKLKSNGGIS